MLKDLVKIANKLDSVGLRKEADKLDLIIRKIANLESDIFTHIVRSGETFSEIVERVGSGSGKTYDDNVKLNLSKNPSFNPSRLSIGQKVYIYVSKEAEGNQRPILPPYTGE